ncbi:MAG: hypothetical protein N4A72_16920 [Bacteroidales bacterium]|jgi:hypothetical protein|nr:hypothetical protein [Bacteroidales bacterium]
MGTKKQIIILAIAILSFTGCSYRVVRNGYEKNKHAYYNCDVLIKKGVTFNLKGAQKVGDIKLGDTGFTNACSEKKAQELLRKEACSIDANLVIITEEKQPSSFGSSCYRCKAELYRTVYPLEYYKDSTETVDYKYMEVHKIKQAKQSNYTAAIFGAVIGTALGILLLAF